MDLKNSHIMTAMVTPFGKDGNIDYDLLKKLINHLLSTGTDGILVSGTTGEGPTLTEEEKIKLIEKTVEYVEGRVPVMAGTGSNNTKATIEYTNKVAKIDGVDAALVVVPYYNKPDQAGMIAHFTAVADNVDLPIVMYNIPGRTLQILRMISWHLLAKMLMLWLPEMLAHKVLSPLRVICSEKKSVKCMPQIQKVTTKLLAS